MYPNKTGSAVAMPPYIDECVALVFCCFFFSSGYYIPFITDFQLQGSLMIAGALHTLVGVTGVVGFLLRFVGPVTVVPALTIMALYVYSATVRFARAQWGIAIM